MDSDVGALVEDTDKLRNFVEDDFDCFLNMNRVVVLLSL